MELPETLDARALHDLERLTARLKRENALIAGLQKPAASPDVDECVTATPKTIFIPLEQAAQHLAAKQWDGVDESAAEGHLRRMGLDKGPLTALDALRLTTEARCQLRIDGLVNEGLIPLYEYPEFAATNDPAGAMVSEAELVKLVLAYKPALPPAGAVPHTKADGLPAPLVTESAAQRRARLFEWWKEEVSIAPTGAVVRVTERERLKKPNADRSSIGKDIAKGREERRAVSAAGPFDGLGS